MTDRADTEAEALARRADAASPVWAAADAAPVLALPDGYTAHDLEATLPHPVRRRGALKFETPYCLAAYVNRFWQPEALALSSPEARAITVILNHHGDRPGWSDHRAMFRARFSADYEAWRSLTGRPLKQKQAGEFLEEWAFTITTPPAADVMEMVMQFEALKRVTFRQSTRLHNGQRQFTYSEENEARGGITLPETIAISVPVFDGMDPQRVIVRVRYRIDDGALVFGFEIAERERIERAAFEQCEDALTTAMEREMPILRGAG